jgi:hypothetical protein
MKDYLVGPSGFCLAGRAGRIVQNPVSFHTKPMDVPNG